MRTNTPEPTGVESSPADERQPNELDLYYPAMPPQLLINTVRKLIEPLRRYE